MKTFYTFLILGIGSVLLAACDSDGNSTAAIPPAPEPEATVSYRVTVTNSTAGQPLSPVAVVMHDGSWSNFVLGSAVSTELETLAEGGDNTAWLAVAASDSGVYSSATGNAPIGPGSNESIDVEVTETQAATLSFSLASMLVNTNDAITSLDGINLSPLEVGQVMRLTARVYDTGTEANTESADTVPGPAAGGGAQEGFNAARDDVRDAVFVHAGVITADDGLASSTLSFNHRWDNPVMQVEIERLN